VTYEQAISKYQPTIGIETHVQLATRSKLFCACDNDARDKDPNTTICPVCLGLPGTLPVLNQGAVNLALRLGASLNGQMPAFTKFDRKNYFYPDLPKGYQITQFDQPIVGPGYVEVPVDGQTVKVGITRAHLEEDAGKLVHPAGADFSLVDLNRAGTPLVEVVSEPDMHTPAEAKAYAHEIYLLVRYSGVGNANLYYGNLRFDVNVSLSPIGSTELGTRSETKNLNSFRAVEKAVESEVIRQAELLDQGGRVVQETRGYNDDTGKTFSQRSKEEADEYRYFPEPDLPPLVITKDMISAAAQGLETPAGLRARLAKFGFEAHEIETALDIPEVTLEFIHQVEADDKLTAPVIKQTAQYFINDLEIRAKLEETGFSMFEQLAAVATATLAGQISSTQAKQAVQEVVISGRTFDSLGLKQVSDSGELEKVVAEVVAANPQAIADYRAGNERALGALVGAAMKATRGQGNPQMLTELIKQHLEAA